MKTEILKGTKNDILIAAKVIKEGGLVAFPTETVYGLGANALDEAAVAKIFIAKGRPSDNPLIVHIYEKSQIEQLAKKVSSEARAVIDKFMPGAITIILKKRECIPNAVTAGLDSVGIRIPSHTLAREFLMACGVPVAAPSANLSTKISPTTAKAVLEDMEGRIPIILDGGSCEVGIESTVLDLTGDIPTILRPGAITAEMLAEVLGEVATFRGKVVSVLPSPGMRYKHYSPEKEMQVVKNTEVAKERYKQLQSDNINPVIIAKKSLLDKLKGLNCIDVGEDSEEICRNIYSAMHYAEKKFDFILAIDFGNDGICGSVMNRVMKAAGGSKILE